MKPYHKIKTVYKHDPKTKYKTVSEGEFATPEFEYLANNNWIFGEKVNGMNIKVHWNHETMSNWVGQVFFEGRTNNAQIPPSLLDKLTELFPAKLMRAKYPETSMGLYGEGYGAKIHKGGNYCQDQNFVLFDVRIGKWWLQRKDIEEIAENLNIDIVPIIGRGTLYDMVNMAKNGIVSEWGEFQAEGIVARPEIELQTRSGHRIITKIKCKDFQ